MTTLREAAQQAQQALEALAGIDSGYWHDFVEGPIAALRTALAEQPAEQEPVAWIDITDEGQIVSSPRMYSDGSREERPLYTSPQPRRRLTDEEICAALDIDGSDDWTFTVAYAIIDAYERKNGVQP